MTTPREAGRATKRCSSATSENQTIKHGNGGKLKRDTKTISASEVNRFTYCQYQWYYERLYGRTELHRLYREKNQEAGYQNKTDGNFKRGRDYHKMEYARYKRKQVIKAVFLMSILLLAVGLYFIVRTG